MTEIYLLTDTENQPSTIIVTDEEGNKIAFTNDPSYFPHPDDDDCPDIIYYTPKAVYEHIKISNSY